MEGVMTPPLWVGVAIATGIWMMVGWKFYQRCPHCGRLVRRVARGWKRCPHCGRQYRRGLRLR